MNRTVDALILDLLEWLSSKDRTYEETMNAWRTSCPRLPVWEDAIDQGLVSMRVQRGEEIVSVTPAGRALLEKKALKL